MPVEKHECSWVNPYDLDVHEDENLKVSLVNFKATGNMRWLESTFELPTRWWINNHMRIPIVQEVLALIRDKKPKQGGKLLMPRHHQSLLPLEVRGKVLWFENNSRVVVLALREGHEEEELLWFLEEMNKDQEGTNPEPDTAAPVGKKVRKTEVPEPLEDLVKDCLQDLEGHPQCLRAHWQNSRHSFRLQRKSDKTIQEVRVKDMKKKLSEALEQDNFEPVQRNFLKAVAGCLAFLDGQDDPDQENLEEELAVHLPAQQASAEAPEEALVEAPAEQALAEAPAEAPETPAPARKRVRRKGQQEA